MTDLSIPAINDSLQGDKVFCKFISALETGENPQGERSILVPPGSSSILFSPVHLSSHIQSRTIQIILQGEINSTAHFKWSTHNQRKQYSIHPDSDWQELLAPEYTGALFILISYANDHYKAYILNTDQEIEAFLGIHALTPAETNRNIIQKELENN